MKKLLLITFIVGFISCKNEPQKLLKEDLKGTAILIKYSKGFTVTDYGTYKILKIKSPWPKAEKEYRIALLKEGYDATFWSNEKNRFDEVIEIPIKKIVVTSTTHIPALELLHAEQTLVGFPGTDYISSEKTRMRVDEGSVRELGKNEGINTEVLLEIKPDVVIGFGIDGNNKTFETIQKSGITVIYNGDWVETSPLAKAEWIKFFGTLYNDDKEADSIFNQIEKDYLKAKKLAAHVENRPTVLSGAMEKDIWYLPSGTSSEAQLLKDANVDYLWAESNEKGSLSLNFETVFTKARDADIWISPSYYASLEAIEKANEHYTKFKSFQDKNVYSFVNKTGETGGVLYFELGMARPDLVLKDLVKICHPELLKDYEPFFFELLK
ncbi:MAG: ABC transporter substrate-binding protein [Aquaticitalea sp.]